MKSLLLFCTDKLGYTDKHHSDISTMFQEADDVLFRSILSNTSHVLHTFLSERPETIYSLRTRSHNNLLIPKTSDLGDRHFIIRSLYKNLYWCYLTHQTKLQCWHCYIYAELLMYFILAMCCTVYFYELCTQLRLTTVFKEWKMRWDESNNDDTRWINKCLVLFVCHASA